MLVYKEFGIVKNYAFILYNTICFIEQVSDKLVSSSKKMINNYLYISLWEKMGLLG